MKNKKNTKSVGSGKRLAFLLLFLLATGLSGTVHADMTLTAAGVAAGFTLTTFATNFPNTGAGGTGPLGIAFPGSGVMVSDWPGNVRVFPSHADGQDAGAVSATAYGTANAVGLAQVAGKLYMAQNPMSRVVQLNPDGTLNQVIVGVFCATGLVTDRFTGHLFVSSGCSGGGIVSVDPVAKTATAFNSVLSDGLALSNDGLTLYAADITGHHVLGFDTTTKAQVFDSGVISFVDGIAVGSGVLAGKIFANTNFGEVWEVDLATSAQTLIASGGSRGDFVAADPSDGTLLVTQSDRILRLHPPAGGSFGNGNLLNISTRLGVGTGNNVLIGGFIITGSSNKQVLLRALGPTLSQFGVTGVLADPTLELHNSAGALLTSNDNWKDTQQSAIMATGKAPPNNLESAILSTLAPGNYTAIVRGKNNTTGVALVEAYDIDMATATTLTNISTRGFVETGQNVMIGGFISGNGAVNVIVRALGPTLTQFGVPNVLADPTLELHDANGATIASNDNWADTQQAAIQASGFAPPNAKESAIVITRPAGNTTAIVRGKNNTTGNALVEVYILPP